MSGRAFGPLTVQLELFLPVLLTVKDGECQADKGDLPDRCIERQ